MHTREPALLTVYDLHTSANVSPVEPNICCDWGSIYPSANSDFLETFCW
jgi:hypothetical protein